MNQPPKGGSKNPSNLPNLGETSAAGMVSIMWHGRRMESNEVVELEEWEEAVALIMMDALDIFFYLPAMFSFDVMVRYGMMLSQTSMTPSQMSRCPFRGYRLWMPWQKK